MIRSTIGTADQFSDNTSEWLLIEHRLQSIKEKFDFLFVKTNREHREIKVLIPKILFLNKYFLFFN